MFKGQIARKSIDILYDYTNYAAVFEKKVWVKEDL